MTRNQWIAALPAFLPFLAVGILPIALLAVDSFIHDGALDTSVISALMTGSRHLPLLMNSLRLASAVTLFSLIIGVPVAFLLAKTDIPLRGPLKLGLATILVLPPYVNAIAWIGLMGQGGYVRGLMERLFGSSPQIYGIWGTTFVLTMSTFPLVVFMSMAAFASINSRLEEAARIAKGWSGATVAVIMPLAAKGILFGALLAFIVAVSDFGVTSFLTYDTFTVDVYSRLAAFNDVRSATAYSLTLTALSLAAVLAFTRTGSIGPLTSISSASSSEKIRLGKMKIPLIMSVFVILSISLIAPLCSLLSMASQRYSQDSPIENFISALSVGESTIWDTIAYSAIGTAVAFILGVAIAWKTQRMSQGTKTAIDATLLLPFIMPGTITGLGMIQLWNFHGSPVYNTPLIIILGYVARFTIIPYKAAEIAFNKVSRTLNDAARLAAAPPMEKAVKITLPLLAPTLVAGLVVTYVLCVSELNNSMMVYPPGRATLPISLFILQHDGPPGVVAALALITILIAIAPIIILSLYRPLGRALKWMNRQR